MSGMFKLSHVESPHFLILVPTIDRNNLLNETLTSIFTQHYKNWTLLVSDNGSTVPVGDTIPAQFLDDSRFNLVRRSRLSTGVEHCEALLREAIVLDFDYFVLLSDDDLFIPETLAEVVRVSTGAPMIATAYASWHMYTHSLRYAAAGVPYRVDAIDEICRNAAKCGVSLQIPPCDLEPQLGPTHMSTYFVRKDVLESALIRYPELMKQLVASQTVITGIRSSQAAVAQLSARRQKVEKPE